MRRSIAAPCRVRGKHVDRQRWAKWLALSLRGRDHARTLCWMEYDVVTDEAVKGPASYFPAIEKKYGRPVAEWQELVRTRMPARHMDLVAMLKTDHGMGHGHANAIVAHTLAAETLGPSRS
jgi:hypothetical protein